MKKLFVALMIVLATSSFSFAVSISDILANGYTETNSDFFSLTDLTTSNAGFTLVFESAAYESTFGIYTADSLVSPTYVTESLEIFGLTSEPSSFSTSVQFVYDSNVSSWLATANGVTKQFSTTFGFYYSVDTNADLAVDYTFYTASNLNSVDSGVDHIRTFFRESDNTLYVLLEDLTAVSPNSDWNDMTVAVSDVAPVPEPATLVLLGSGLVGLAFLKRRKA